MARLIPIVAARQRKHEFMQAARAIMSVAEKENRELTTAESQNLAKVEAALKDAEARIVLCEQQLAEEAGLPLGEDENAAFAAMAQGGTPTAGFGNLARRKAAGRVGIKSYDQLFGRPRGNAGFKSFDEYLGAVKGANQLFDPRLRASMTGDVPSQSGFLVPEEFAAYVLNYALENSICMQRCQVWPMASSVLKVPGVLDTDHSAGTLFGGVTEIWYDELKTLDEQNIKTRLIQLTAHKLGMLANASSELVEDAASYESILEANLQSAAAFFMDRAFLRGDGTAKPLGMLAPGNDALVVVAKNASTPTGGILYEDVTAMFLAMAPACRNRAEWLFTDELIPALLKMQLVVKNVAASENVGGSATPMFTMNSDGTGTLLGRPARFTEKLVAAGTQGDAAFLCYDQYSIGIRRELQLRRSLDAGFKEDSVWWRLTTRIDGMPQWGAKLKLSNGTYVSPFVTLAARS
jgi:HK97 family phage major capsid protein